VIRQAIEWQENRTSERKQIGFGIARRNLLDKRIIQFSGHFMLGAEDSEVTKAANNKAESEVTTVAKKSAETLAALHERTQGAVVSLAAARTASRFVQVCCTLLACAMLATGVPATESDLDKPTLAWMQAALDNWEAICRRHLHVAVEPLPWIIFYDEHYAWHLNPEKELLPPHEAASASLTFAGRRYALMRVAHAGGLWVPGREPLPVSSRGVTMLYADEQKPFFIVPLPSLYRKLAGVDQAPALDELFLGLACHELAHTRQLVYAVQRINALRAQHKLPESIDDDMIQHTFGTNDDYRRLYEEERGHLMRAILADKLDDCRRALAQALSVSEQRKKRFFVGDYEGWSDLDDIFLAMEGLGMWVHAQMALDHAPKGEDWRQTLVSLSEKTAALWSQEEGLGLFLLIDRLVPSWQARFLAPDFPSPFAVLREAIRKRAPLKPAVRSRKKRKEMYR
jgi:hypothetical protein